VLIGRSLFVSVVSVHLQQKSLLTFVTNAGRRLKLPTEGESKVQIPKLQVPATCTEGTALTYRFLKWQLYGTLALKAHGNI
jgi:hypothetical protein